MLIRISLEQCVGHGWGETVAKGRLASIKEMPTPSAKLSTPTRRKVAGLESIRESWGAAIDIGQLTHL